MSQSGSAPARRIGELSDVDPFALEPGVMVGERFCVVGPVRHFGRGWCVAVTDLWREFGDAPHHRAEVHHLVLSRRDRSRLRRTIQADATMQPKVFMAVDGVDGTDLVIEERVGSGGALPKFADASSLILGLTDLLAALHENHVSGVNFLRDHVSETAGVWGLTSFAHLSQDEGIDTDLKGVGSFLLEAFGEDVQALLNPHPVSAEELRCRARSFFSDEPLAPTDILPSTAPFVGRAGELESLQMRYRDAVVATPSLTVIEGERGVGKSRLLDEFDGWLRSQSEAIVVRGEFVESANRLDKGLAEALTELCEGLERFDPASAVALQRRLAVSIKEPGVLARHVPALRRLVDADPVDEAELEDEFLRYTETVAALLLTAGTGRVPVVMLLENGEHADACTIGVLRHLAAAAKGCHLQVVMTVRGRSAESLRAAGASVLELGALGSASFEDLLTHSLPGPIVDADSLAAELFESSEGLPLAAWAALQLWLKDSALTTDARGRWRRDPTKKPGTGIEELVLHRFERLLPSPRALAVLLAAREGIVDRSWIGRVTGSPDSEIRRDLETLVRAGIVARAGSGRYRFWHGEVRHAVLQAAEQAEISAAHRKIVEWLRSGSKPSIAQLAYHEELAGIQHPQSPSQHLRAALELLAVYESSAAQWHLEFAFAGQMSAEEGLAAVEAAGDAALLSGDGEKAGAWYRRAVGEAPTQLGAVLIASKAVRALYARANGPAAIEVGRAALARVGYSIPNSGPAKAGALIGAFLSVRFPVRLEPDVRSALCKLFAWLSACFIIGDPLNVGVCIVRGYRVSRGLQTGNAALAHAFYAGLKGLMGQLPASAKMLEEAEAMGLATADDWALANVHHIRGHVVQLPADEYAEGQASLDLAVEHFRRTGDLSVAVLSMYFKSIYGYQRESAETLLGWLAETDSLAVRHGNELARLEIEGLRLLVESRRGLEGVVDRARSLEARIDGSQAVTHDVLLASTYTAAALLRAGETTAAKERILSARSLVSSLPGMPEVAMDVYTVVVDVLAAQPTLSSSELKVARSALRQLRRAGKQSPRLHTAYLLGSSRLDRRNGRVARAKKHAEDLLRLSQQRGMTYMQAEAHLELFHLLSPSDVLAAAEHARLAASLKRSLGYREALPGEVQVAALPAADTDPADSDENSSLPELRAGATSLQSALVGLDEYTKDALRGIPLLVNVDAAAQADCSTQQLQSIVVNLLLTARDALPTARRAEIDAFYDVVGQSRASELAGGTAGSFLVVRVRAMGAAGPITSTYGGLSGCRQAVSRVGGFLVVEPNGRVGVSLSAYVPTSESVSTASAPPPDRTAAVVHADAFVRRTVVAALAQMGFECQDLGPNPGHLGTPTILFADAGSLEQLGSPPHSARVIELVQRGGSAKTQFASLSVPFVVGDLQQILLAEASTDRQAN